AGRSVDLGRLVELRAACGSDGPLLSFFTHLSPRFSYWCLSAAKATRCALPPSPYVSTALSWAFFQMCCACFSERMMVLGMSVFSVLAGIATSAGKAALLFYRLHAFGRVPVRIHPPSGDADVPVFCWHATCLLSRLIPLGALA